MASAAGAAVAGAWTGDARNAPEVVDALASWANADPHAVDAALKIGSSVRVLLDIITDESYSESARSAAEEAVNAIYEGRSKSGGSPLHCLGKSAPLALEPTILEVRITPSDAVATWFASWAHPIELHSGVPHAGEPTPLVCATRVPPGKSSTAPTTDYADSALLLRITMPSDQARIKNSSPIPMILWPASLLLGRLLLSVPHLTRHKRVLELGAGFHAICALACAYTGVERVVTTDCDGTALERMRGNVVNNAHAVETRVVHVERLDWRQAENSDALLGEQFDVIIGSDIIHERVMASLIEGMIRRFLKADGVCVIVNAQKAHRFGVEEFQAQMETSADFDCRVVPLGEDVTAECSVQDTFYDCYSIKWKKGE